MKKSLNKDITRTIWKEKKRFIAIMLITTLGVTMMTCLGASCRDLRLTADEFYRNQNLYDINVVSTLGLTDEDVAVLSELDGIEEAEGTYTEIVRTKIDEQNKTAEVKMFRAEGINVPYIVEGNLPEAADEIAVTENYIHESGKKIGDIVEISEFEDSDDEEEDSDEETADEDVEEGAEEQEDAEEDVEDEEDSDDANYLYTSYTITAIVVDAADVNNPEGAVSFRATPNADYTFFVLPEAVDSEIYTGIYLTVDGASELMAYSEEYEEKVASVVSKIEAEIMESREQARYDEIKDDALDEIAEKEAEMNQEFADAQQELDDAATEIEDAKEQILDAKAEIEDGKEQIADAKKEIADGKEQIADGKKQIEDGKKQLASGKKELEEQEKKANEEIAAAKKEIEDGYAQLEQKRAYLSAQNMLTAEVIAELDGAKVQLDAGAAQLNAQEQAAKTEFEKAWKEINEKETQLKESEAELLEKEAELEEGEAELLEKEAELEDGEAELLENEKELEDGELEYLENLQKYEEEKADAQQKIQDAKDEVNDLDMAQWYVQDRTSLSGYSNVSNDADTIESLATVFMVVFFIVAILISLTTITRMVEEERGLIGTYKALGFHDGEIRRKYMIYAFAASLAGGILGDFAGFVILPEIVFSFFKVMYAFPHFNLYFDFASGTYSVLLFMAGIVGAAFFACLVVLRQNPASLMRPKAPKMGSRVLLERITPLWKRLSFLNKVTARNLFRYKKRLFMTILGIMGCTALVVFGFAIKDSVEELMPLQYDNVNHYDVLAATSADDNDKLVEYMNDNEEVEDYLNMLVTTVKLENADKDSEKVQLMVFEDNQGLKKYLNLMNPSKEEITLEDGSVYLTENAAKIFGLAKGDSFTIQTQELLQEEAEVAELVKNYLGNYLYMTKDTYEDLFGTYEANGVLANLAESCEDHIAFSKTLSQEDWILSSLCTQDMKENFSLAFTLINIVVYVVLVMAAGLAFVVLFTLASINISERNRELATIKVLGFYDPEVHSYVNKETLILTSIGIFLGLPVGRFISSSLTHILSVPSVYFEVTIYPQSYLYAAGISLLFALMVQIITNRSLDVIDPVEALKSVE